MDVCYEGTDLNLETDLQILIWAMACTWLSTPEVEADLNPPPGIAEEAQSAEGMLGEGDVLVRTGEMVLEELEWTLGDRKGWVWLVRMPRSAELTVWPSPRVQRLKEFPPLKVDGVQVNGGFYDEAAMGLVVHSGKVEAQQTDFGGSGILFWSSGRGLQIAHRDAFKAEGVSEAVQSVDRLVDGGKSLVRVREGVPETSRVAVGHSATEVLVAIAGGWGSTERDGLDLVLGASVADQLS